MVKRFSIHFKSRILRRILLAMLSITFASLVGLAAVSINDMRKLGNYALSVNKGLGMDAVGISKSALEKLATEGLLRITQDQAAISNAEFQRIEDAANTLASYAGKLWNGSSGMHNRRIYTTAEKPKNEYAASVYRVAPGIPFEKVRHEAVISSSMDDLFIPLLANNPNISVIEMGTPNGLFRRYPWAGDLPEDYDHRKREWYKMAVKDKKMGWTDPYISAIKKELRVNCYKPVYDSKGSLIAVIGVVIPLKTINERVINTKLGEKGHAILVDAKQDLKIIASEGRAGTEKGQSILTDEVFSLDAVHSEKEQQMEKELREGKAGLLRGLYKGQESFVAYAPVATTKWAVLIVLSVESVTQPVRPTEHAIMKETSFAGKQVDARINRSLLSITGIFVVLIVAVFIIAFVVAQRIVAPILTLQHGAKAVGDGKLDYSLDVRTGDEIEDLANSFNKMAGDLKEYIRNLTEVTAARERIESELRVATEIQTSLLPKTFPPFPDRPEFDIYALMDPAKEVGGDFYDFFFIDNKHFCLLIGDVSDKGVPAALFMMVTKTLLKTEACRADLAGKPIFSTSPEEILFNVNNYLYPDNRSLMFTTVFIAILNTETGELCYSNAGHNPPLLFTDGKAEFIPLPSGFVLSAMPNTKYTSETLLLKEDDIILLYTDGVTEAKNISSELFGEGSLLKNFTIHAVSNVDEIIMDIRSVVRDFSVGAPQSDDITMLALKFKGKINS